MRGVPKQIVKWFLLALYFCSACASTKPIARADTTLPRRFISHPFATEHDLDLLLKEIGDAKIVLLGEASHGTAEYYNWRAAISKRLILERGFNLIAAEGDYIDFYRLNHCIRGDTGDTSILHVLSGFDRWPQWLWSNQEFLVFAQWIKDFNVKRQANKKISLAGLDVFNFATALNELLSVLDDTTALTHARQVQACLKPFGADALRYSTAVSKRSANCKEEINKLWQAVQEITGEKIDNEKELLLILHASVVKDGEEYFRLRNSDAAVSWNSRVSHMQQTIKRLLQFYGHESKIIIWAHNTHIGDAHYTDMPTRRRTNIGGLLRSEYGEKNIFSVGFGSYSGEIIGGYTWGAPFSRIKIRPAKVGSWEQLLHMDGAYNKILLAKDLVTNTRLRTWVEQRSIGVVYSETYIPSIIPRRYDAFVYFDSTHAIHPLK